MTASNLKSEARNSKKIQMRNPNDSNRSLALWVLCFGIVSEFVFRVSDFYLLAPAGSAAGLIADDGGAVPPAGGLASCTRIKSRWAALFIFSSNLAIQSLKRT